MHPMYRNFCAYVCCVLPQSSLFFHICILTHNYTYPPPHTHIYRGQTACVKELLANGADPNKQDQLQHTPFMMAAWFGKIDAAREIFEKVGTVCNSVCAWCMCVSLCFFCGCFSV